MYSLNDNQLNLNKNIIDSLFNRQINNKFTSCHRNQIVKSFYDKKTIFRSEIDCESKTFVNFSKDENYMISASYDGLIKVLNIDNDTNFNSENKKMRGPFKLIHCLDSNYDFSKIYAVYQEILLIDTLTFQLKTKIKTKSFVYSMSVSPIDKNISVYSNIQSKSISFLDDRISTLQNIEISDVIDSFYSVQYHPNENNLLLLTSEDRGVFTFDLRNKKINFQYDIFQHDHLNEVVARYNKKGDQIFVTRNDFNPLLFKTNESNALYEFSEFSYYHHYGYTIGCFAGPNDEFVVTGSEDFNIYLWEIPKEKLINYENELVTKTINFSKFIFKGHNSIIKQICYNSKNSLLSSSDNSRKIILYSFYPLSLQSKFNKTYSSDYKNKSFSEYLTRYENSSINNHIFNFKIKHEVIFRNNFTLYLKNLNNSNFELLYLTFKKDSKINYIKSIIINYKIEGKKLYLKLMNIINDVILKEFNPNNENNQKFDIDPLYLLIAIKKIHQKKIFLTDSIYYLKKQLILLEIFETKAKNELNLILNSYYYYRIVFTIKEILNDVKLILKENKNLYSNSIFCYETLINRYFMKRN